MTSEGAGARGLQRLRSWLYEYWFGPGEFALSLAAIRIAVAGFALCGGFLGSPASYSDFLRLANHDIYQPKGVLLLLGPTVPPTEVFVWACYLSWISAVLLLVGLCSRSSLVVNLCCNLLLAAITVSFRVGWGHKASPFLTLQIALVLAPLGDQLSVDALLRGWRGRPAQRVDGASSRWRVLLAQLSMALVFADGAWWKLVAGGWRMAWVFSDSFRHWLVIQYYLDHRPLTAAVQWILADERHYQLVALGNILSQLAPLAACCCIRRPLLRALLGSCFLFEVGGICVVMSMCSFGAWWMLFPVFVDWDRLVAWWQQRRVATEESVVGGFGVRRRMAASYVAGFLGLSIWTGFARRNPVDWAFPFTNYKLYDSILAKTPYGEHQTWEQLGTTFDADPPIPEAADEWLYKTYGFLGTMQEVDIVGGTALSIRKTLEQRYGHPIPQLRLKRTVFQIPAYPAWPEPVALHAGLAGILFRDHYVGIGTDVGWDNERRARYITIRSQGLAAPDFRLSYLPRKIDSPRPLPGAWEGPRYYFSQAELGDLIVVDVIDAEVSGGRARFFGGTIH